MTASLLKFIMLFRSKEKPARRDKQRLRDVGVIHPLTVFPALYTVRQRIFLRVPLGNIKAVIEPPFEQRHPFMTSKTNK